MISLVVMRVAKQINPQQNQMMIHFSQPLVSEMTKGEKARVVHAPVALAQKQEELRLPPLAAPTQVAKDTSL